MVYFLWDIILSFDVVDVGVVLVSELMDFMFIFVCCVCDDFCWLMIFVGFVMILMIVGVMFSVLNFFSFGMFELGWNLVSVESSVLVVFFSGDIIFSVGFIEVGVLVGSELMDFKFVLVCCVCDDFCWVMVFVGLVMICMIVGVLFIMFDVFCFWIMMLEIGWNLVVVEMKVLIVFFMGNIFFSVGFIKIGVLVGMELMDFKFVLVCCVCDDFCWVMVFVGLVIILVIVGVFFSSLELFCFCIMMLVLWNFFGFMLKVIVNLDVSLLMFFGFKMGLVIFLDFVVCFKFVFDLMSFVGLGMDCMVVLFFFVVCMNESKCESSNNI